MMVKLAPPVAFGVFVVGFIQLGLAYTLLNFKPMQLPPPSAVASAFIENFQAIARDSLVTVGPTLAGMIVGSLIGYLTAVFITRFPKGGFGLLYIMIAINSVPIVALAPIMNRWFTQPFPAKVSVVIIISMGAMAVNAFRGLSDLPDESRHLMRACDASNMEVFTKLRIPASLPYVFTALKINVSVAMMGTIIGEYFNDNTSGIGYMIKYTLRIGNRKAEGWAYILAAAIISILIYAALTLAQRRLVRWHASQRMGA
jgi:NitT/TauT family transport system permease protein